MDIVFLSPLTESYGIENFAETTREILRETDLLFSMVCLQENSVDNLLLTEAVESNKNFLVNALEKMIVAIKALGQRFSNIATRLVTSNKAWIAKAKSMDIAASVSDRFTYEIFPYWKAEGKLRNYQFPEFKETPEFIQELSNMDEFKMKYFKDLHITTDGKTEFNPKEFFQGGHTKIKMNKAIFMSQVSNMISFVETYDELAKSINVRNNKIMEFIKSIINKIRSGSLRESNEILTTINTLLEQGDAPSTTNNIDDKPTDPNKPDGREEGKDSNKAGKDVIKAREAYNKLIYSINSARMGVAESCYNAYANAIHQAINNKPQTEPAKQAQPQPTNKPTK
jgi:hypothetical protein